MSATTDAKKRILEGLAKALDQPLYATWNAPRFKLRVGKPVSLTT